MPRLILALFIFGSAASLQSPIPQQDIDAALVRAETLYFGAKFRESLELISPLDTALRLEPERVNDKIRVKLQMALAHVGLNETEAAKALFREVSVLDPAYVLDKDQFAPKIITLFDDAKAERIQARCTTVCAEVARILDSGNIETLLPLLDAPEADCPCLQSSAFDAAEISYQKGLEAYKQDDFVQALEHLRLSLKLRPSYDLAAQYVELAEGKLRLATDRVFLDWRLYFGSRDFPRAAEKYRELQSLNLEGLSTPAVEQIRAEYLKMLNSMADAWTGACRVSPVLAAETRRQATAMLPDPSFGAEILEKMNTCPTKTCQQISSQLAWTRLRTRVNPQIPRDAMPSRTTPVTLKVRIDEEGNVQVNSMQGGNRSMNPAIQAAVELWKFAPAIVGTQAQCVETDLRIDIVP